jgi:hypothetical protein
MTGTAAGAAAAMTGAAAGAAGAAAAMTGAAAGAAGASAACNSASISFSLFLYTQLFILVNRRMAYAIDISISVRAKKTAKFQLLFGGEGQIVVDIPIELSVEVCACPIGRFKSRIRDDIGLFCFQFRH